MCWTGGQEEAEAPIAGLRSAILLETVREMRDILRAVL